MNMQYATYAIKPFFFMDMFPIQLCILNYEASIFSFFEKIGGGVRTRLMIYSDTAQGGGA
jgi:hypothetical protein